MGVLSGFEKKLGVAMGSSAMADAIISQIDNPVYTTTAPTFTDAAAVFSGDAPVLAQGGATAVVALAIGQDDGTRISVIDEVVTLTNAVETNLTSTVPAGAVILSTQVVLHTAVTGDASGDDLLAKVGVGVTADPDKYAITPALTANSKHSKIPTWAVLGAEETVTVKAAKTDGSACTEKFVGGGLVRVRIVYLTTADLVSV